MFHFAVQRASVKSEKNPVLFQVYKFRNFKVKNPVSYKWKNRGSFKWKSHKLQVKKSRMFTTKKFQAKNPV